MRRERMPEAARPTTHRAVLMLVDGLTQEMAAEDYRTALEPRDVQLLVLNIKVR